MFGQYLGVFVGGYTRRTLSILPPLRMLDTAGGIALGAVTGLAICWAIGAVLLYVPGQSGRRLAQESVVVSTLTDALPPSRVIDAVERIDHYVDRRAGRWGRAPDVAIARDADVLAAARRSVVRVRGTACELEVEVGLDRAAGARRHERPRRGGDPTDPVIDRRDGKEHSARVVSFDARNDLAILRVSGLEEGALPLADPVRGQAGALLGLENPGAQSDARSSGPGGDDQLPRRVRTPGVGPAGRRPARRRRSGNSGGPIVDDAGRAVATIFAQRRSSEDGFAVPNDRVRALANLGPALDTACVAR